MYDIDSGREKRTPDFWKKKNAALVARERYYANLKKVRARRLKEVKSAYANTVSALRSTGKGIKVVAREAKTLAFGSGVYDAGLFGKSKEVVRKFFKKKSIYD